MARRKGAGGVRAGDSGEHAIVSRRRRATRRMVQRRQRRRDHIAEAPAMPAMPAIERAASDSITRCARFTSNQKEHRMKIVIALASTSLLIGCIGPPGEREAYPDPSDSNYRR